MNLKNPSLYKSIKKVLEKFEIIRLAKKSDEDSLHGVLESVGMKFADTVEIFYSRRPSLWKSFEQSSQIPIIFTNPEEQNFMSAICEGQVLKLGEVCPSYYFSDMRIKKTASPRLRREYKNIFPELVSLIKDFKYTVIFNDNKMAMRALTSKRNKFSYNKLTEYVARTFFVLPFWSPSVFKIVAVNESNYSDYIQFNQNFEYDMEHLNLNKDHFLIKKNNLIIGSFSTFKPTCKSLLVRSRSWWINSILSLNKWISQKENSRLSWRYISHLRVKSENHTMEFLPNFISSLKNSRAVKVGELVVMLYDPKYEYYFDKPFISFAPQLVSRATIFQVEIDRAERDLKGEVLLDPNQL